MIIQWRKEAYKQLHKLPIRDQEAIRNAVDSMSAGNNINVKALKGHKYGYRLRVGRYRVLFDRSYELKIIAIYEVKKRDENTY